MHYCGVTSQASDILGLAVYHVQGLYTVPQDVCQAGQSSTRGPCALITGMPLLEPPEQQATRPPSSCDYLICLLGQLGSLLVWSPVIHDGAAWQHFISRSYLYR